MTSNRKLTRKQRGGQKGTKLGELLSRAVRYAPTATAVRAPYRVNPVATLAGTALRNPMFGQPVRFASEGPRRPVVNVGHLPTEARPLARRVAQTPTNGDKTKYTAGTFPYNPPGGKWTKGQVLKIRPDQRIGIFTRIFGGPPTFPFETDEEFMQGFFAKLREENKLADGILPSELGTKVDTSPEATMKEGSDAENTVMPSTNTAALTLAKASDVLPENYKDPVKFAELQRIQGPELTQQANLLIEMFPPAKAFARILISPNNVPRMSSYVGYEGSARVLLSSNDVLFAVCRKGLEDGFDPKKFFGLFTEGRLLKLKTGIVNFYAMGNKQEAFQVLDLLLQAVKYDAFDPITLDGFLSTLVTKPNEASSRLEKIYYDKATFVSKTQQMPVLEKIKSSTWHWYKYATQGKFAGILAVIMILLALRGIYTLDMFQREVWHAGRELGVAETVTSVTNETKLIGRSIQNMAQPITNLARPATEALSEAYGKATEEERRKQYLFYRLWNAYFAPKTTKGGALKTRRMKRT
jgi:hypothetical protein